MDVIALPSKSLKPKGMATTPSGLFRINSGKLLPARARRRRGFPLTVRPLRLCAMRQRVVDSVIMIKCLNRIGHFSATRSRAVAKRDRIFQAKGHANH
jgi:hypothetical protein